MKVILKKIVFGAVVTLIIAALVITFFRHRESNNYKQRGTELINKIEAFRHEYKRLPNTVVELGLEEPMNEGPYYEKKDSMNYIVFFNIGFDNTKQYYSKTKQWKDEP